MASNESKAMASPLNVTLTEGRRALWKGNPPQLFRWLLNPLRSFMFDPLLAINSVLMPLFMPLKLETVTADLFRMTILPVIGIVYGKDTYQNGHRSATESILHQPQAVPIKPPTDSYSAFMGAVSFVCSSIQDLAGLVTNPKKYHGWIGALTQFNNFLQETGIGDEIYESIQKPLMYGRLICNFKILNDIQEQANADRAEITRATNITKPEQQKYIEMGHVLMRYATAAYGTEMIRSAVDSHVYSPELLETHKASIAFHALRGDEGEVAFISSENDKALDQHVLHHFVAVSHSLRAIVLSIRGTLSLSGAIIDVQGMAVDFCTGKAHKGIAEMATNLWKHSGSQIMALMKGYPTYKLLITGHSLGAGTATLLNIKLHVQKELEGRTIQCYAFAPPPTFWPYTDDTNSKIISPLVERAMQNTVAFIHDNDVVPFLSVSAIRRMAHRLDSVDNKTELLWFWKRWQIFQEFIQIPDDIVENVLHTKLVADLKEGESRMIIPAQCILWCKEIPGGEFMSYACDPLKVAETDIFLCPDMVSDHLPEEYEDCLDALLAKQREGS